MIFQCPEFIYPNSVPIEAFSRCMSPYRALSLLKYLGSGTARLPTRFLTPSSIAFPATVQPPRHNSTIPPSPLPADYSKIQEMASITGEPVGQSGCHYLIERVLQEKGLPPRRVYLATYVLLKFNCQHELTC